MKAQQPHKNTNLVVLATTAAPSTLQNFWNIDGAAKHLFIIASYGYKFTTSVRLWRWCVL